MPKNYTAKKTYKKKRYVRKRKPTSSEAMYKIAKQVVRGSVPVKEIRFNIFNNLVTNGTVAQSFGWNNLLNISQGDQYNERTGRKIYVFGVKLNFSLQNNSVTKSRGFRSMVVHTKNRDGDLLDTSTWTDLYTDTAYANRTADKLSADLTFPLNTGILNVLSDRQYHIASEGDTGGAKVISLYIPIKKLVEYDNTGSTTSINSGLIYHIVHLCELDDDTSSTTSVRVTGMARVFYRNA